MVMTALTKSLQR